MRYMHTPAGYDYYWIVIPVVGLFVVLFNAYRMGKFRDSSLRGKVVGTAVLAVAAVAALSLLNERVLDSYLVPSDGLAAYPDLEEAFLDQQEGIAGEQIVVVEMGNLFWSHEVYLIPCYDAVIRDVPQNGQTHWSAAVWVIGTEPDKEEFSAIELRNLELKMDFGEETFLSSKVELNGGEDLYDMGTDRRVLLKDGILLPAGEKYSIGALAGTSHLAEVENKEVQGSFIWSYDLYLDGIKVAEIRHDTICGTYLINAT